MTKVIKTSLPTDNWIDNVPVRIVFPDDHVKESNERRSVLFLLHGLFGSCDNWIELTDLVRKMDGRSYLAVTPEAHDSWYIDSETDKRLRYETFFVKDLIGWVDKSFSTTGKRAIAGLSMGGFAAIKFRLKRPELFEFAWSSSGAFSAPRVYSDSQEFVEIKESVVKALGDEPTPARKENDLFDLIECAPPDAVSDLFFDCGIDDQFLAVNRQLDEALTRRGIEHEYREYAGGHDWDYWGERLNDILDTADRYLG